MTANELFAWMEVMNPSPYTAEQKTLWLNDLEASLWTEVLLQPAGLWKGRMAEEGDRPLLLPENRRMLYAMYLWAMMDFARGEHGNYANSMALYNDHLAQLQCWYAENYAPAMTPAVWTEWATCTYEGTGEPKSIIRIPGGCAVLGSECRVEEAGDLQLVTLGTEAEPEDYMPAGAADMEKKGPSRFFRFTEPYDRAVYAHGEGSGTVRFRLLLQPEARRAGHSVDGLSQTGGGPGAVGAVVAGEKGEPGPAGVDGKSAYAYAVDGGYTGTEAEFSAKLAAENTGVHIGPEAPEDQSLLWVDTDEEAEETESPTVFPNPHALTVNGEAYDGSEPVEVNIEAEQPDWNAAEGEPGHVLNRTHYAEFSEENAIVPETVVTFTADTEYVGVLQPTTPLVIGNTYKVVWDGVEYIRECVNYAGMPCVGNFVYAGSDFEDMDSGEPFFMVCFDGQGLMCMSDFLMTATEGSATVKILAETVHKLPEKFLPDFIKPYVITLTKDDTTTFTGTVDIERINYDEFAEHAWNGGKVVVDLSAFVSGVYQRLVSIACSYMDGEFYVSFYAEGSVFSLKFPNGTWTPHGYTG